MNKSINLTIAKPKLPVLLQVSATIIIVMGIVGFLFFAGASIYQYYNPQFLDDLSNNNNLLIPLNFYIIIQVLLHAILIVSGFLIFKLKKIGFYLFISVFLIMLASEVFLENKLILSYIIVGLILAFILMRYYRRFV
ncbi:MAG: hypothetical protein CL661_01960 [Bacteroidetes bacterium]|jgi:hypothetical protein|nr:hypothetical protein [Bacteroidota bacterium]|tara:strand:+ start:1976 stop:2386 length:411 start_codon:yes stop_codon:yes gene_type:complete